MYRSGNKLILVLLLILALPLTMAAQGGKTGERWERFSEIRKDKWSHFDSTRTAFYQHYSQILKGKWNHHTSQIERREFFDTSRFQPRAALDVPRFSRQLGVRLEMPERPVVKPLANPENKNDSEPPAEPVEITDDTAAEPVVRYDVIDIYGIEINMPAFAKPDIRVKDMSDDRVNKSWLKLCMSFSNEFIESVASVKRDYNLSDWLFLCFVNEYAAHEYGRHTSEATLLAYGLMLSCGYDVCLARTLNRLYLLTAVNGSVLGHSVFHLENANYVLFFEKDDAGMFLCRGRNKDSKPLDLHENNVGFPYKAAAMRHIEVECNPASGYDLYPNANLIAYLGDLPDYYVGDPITSFYYHASNKLSTDVSDSFYSSIRRAIHGMDEVQSINYILLLLQTGLEYKTDREVWGKERYFYPEETIYYPYCDCEDRAILFSRIVRDILQKKVCLVLMPNHLSAAVRLDAEIEGEYIIADGEKYYICDPTYIYATAGMSPFDIADDTFRAIILD